jgi:hypothetical protein
MGTSWQIGLFIGLAVLGGRTSAFAQAQPGTGPATGQGQAPASAPAASAATAARRPADPSFNRVTTSGRASAYGTSRAAYGTGTSSATGAMGQDDPLRPYSARVREANSRSVIGSTRTPPPQPTAVQPRPTPSYNYYPCLRTGQHPNANVPQRRHCTPSRGAVLAGGMGRGR